MQQRAATLWYHDHRIDFTGQSVYRGLAGFHLVWDEQDDATGLPTGDREIPLMITDRAFAADGSQIYPALDPSMLHTPGVQDDYMFGVLADVILVNGAPWPWAEVDAARYRLRVLNASNARRYQLRLDPPPPTGSPFVQVGSDGGQLRAPVPHQQLTIAPAERFEVVVDFGSYPVGTDVTVLNDFGDGRTAQVMQFRVARSAKDDSRIPESFAPIEDLSAVAPAAVRTFRFARGTVADEQQGWTINGLPFDPDRADAAPILGTVERWRFVTDLHHPVHVHLNPFQVVRRGNRGPGDFDAGWKDTVDIGPGEVVEVAVRFTDYAGRYLLHCHNLEHEDMMMMMSMFRTRQ
jgi:spore coat protein A